MSIAGAEFGDLENLRRFGRAIVQDERRPLGETVASQLVEQLIRKAMVGVIPGEDPASARSRIAVFSRFIALHRRFVWKSWAEENDYGWPDPSLGRSDKKVKSAVQALPLDQREALLLVTLARFAHKEAAEALGVSLSQFIQRLDKARVNLAASLAESENGARPESWDRAPYLRIVK
jgi:predicted DNA-binding protein (UPF0251 family)